MALLEYVTKGASLHLSVPKACKVNPTTYLLVCSVISVVSFAVGVWLVGYRYCLLGVHSLNMTVELDGSMVGWRGFLDSSSWNTELHRIREHYLVQYLMGVLTIQHINMPTSIETVVHECIYGGNDFTNQPMPGITRSTGSLVTTHFAVYWKRKSKVMTCLCQCIYHDDCMCILSGFASYLGLELLNICGCWKIYTRARWQMGCCLM